jgi:Late exocytosis, associated with Golgi transport
MAWFLTGLQLLNFFKMSFYLFSVCSVLALVVLMPINVRVSRVNRPSNLLGTT